MNFKDESNLVDLDACLRAYQKMEDDCQGRVHERMKPKSPAKSSDPLRSDVDTIPTWPPPPRKS